MMAYTLICILGYLIGSIPFGLLFTKIFGLGDIRSIGSGNIGATNVLRTGSKKVAFLTLLFDMLKGAVAVWIGQTQSPEIGMLAGLFAFIGHCYPVWLNFKGGKGVAVFFGIIFAINGPLAIVTAITWLLVAYISRISSLAALVAVVISVLFSFLFIGIMAGLSVGIMAGIIIWRHRENVKRLLSRNEPKIGKAN